MASGDHTKQDTRMIAEYVIKNIDTALENGWVKVYYQPVIRSLTGQLCGAESLARWDDPNIGFLSPDKFIGALEASRQIHKLDCFIVEKVCSDISARLKKGFSAIPVSVNFSRLDFESRDMLRVVENAIEKYDIPRDYIHIEITESMIVSDGDLMTQVIGDFRGAGFEVWMDDFGSGYSSLTLLKDYYFDTLKMDMNFLESITDRSKAIMTSTITMAKDIGLKTLAEGVETSEQIDFLKSIGCGKLQGYFYGKPMPIDAFFEHMAESGITIEEREWHHFYQQASFAARYTDEPLELVEDDGENFRTLFMNDAYRAQIQVKNSLSLEELDKLIYKTKSPLLKKYREYANIMESTKNQETFYYTYNGNVLCLQGKEIAEHGGRHIIKASNRNISMDTNLKKQSSVDNKLKELNHIFDSVLVMNPERNTIMPLLGNFAYSGRFSSDANDSLDENLKIMAEKIIAPSDRERFLKFADFETLIDRIGKDDKGFVENIFRLKQKDGNYKWREVTIMTIPGTHGREFIISTKPTAYDTWDYLADGKDIFDISKFKGSDGDTPLFAKMFENILENTSIKFFWKDKERRFLGASKSFLEFFELSIDELLGRTDEDMKWHVDDDKFQDDETEVLTKGTFVKNSPGHVIVGGVVYNIMANKSPIYEKGEIVGLMGYFVDVGDEMSRLDKLYKEKTIDSVTGLMNIFALHDATASYAHAYSEKGMDYALIILRSENHSRITADYGENFANKLLKKMADIILDVAGGNCAIGKSIASDFAIITNDVDKQHLNDLVSNLKKALENIKELEGSPITVRIKIAFRLRSDKEISDETMYTVVLQDLM